MSRNIQNSKSIRSAKNFIGNQIGKQVETIGEYDVTFNNGSETVNIQISRKALRENGIRSTLDGIKKLLLFDSLSGAKFNTMHTKQTAEYTTKPIGIFMEGANHYTGGRYYIYHMAVLLSQYVPVIFYTDREPIFKQDFEPYLKGNENFKMVIESRMNFSNIPDFNNLHDVVIGAPRQGGFIAHAYSEALPNVRLISIIFETPNYVSKFRDGNDGNEDYWQGYKKVMQNSDAIIAISETTKEYAAEWIGQQHKDKIHVVYPNVNYYAADIAAKKSGASKPRKKQIAYVSRMVQFKNPMPLIKKLNKSKYAFHLIGKITKNVKDMAASLKQMGYEITLYDSINDIQKYSILRKCDALIHPSTFEGFGIPPMEAGLCGLPVFAYDIPVFREVYGNTIMYMPKGKEVEFIDTMMEKGNIELKAEALRNRSIEINNRQATAAKFLDVIQYPKITTGTIVFNGLDYLPYMLQSIYNSVYQIIIVDGMVAGYGGDNNNGKSIDGTIEYVKDFIQTKDIMGKVQLVTLPIDKKHWADKVDMQNEIAKRIVGEYYIKMDSDEIWKSDMVRGVINFMQNNKAITILRMPFHHFWLNFKQVAVDIGGKWSSVHPRVWRWNKSFMHRKSFNYFESKMDDKKFEKVDEPKYKAAVYSGESIYHFGYVRKMNILQNKIRYYKNRGIEDPNQVNDTVTGWKQGENTQPTQTKKSGCESFAGELPSVLFNHPYANIDDIRNQE